MATGWKIYKAAYLVTLCVSAASATEPAFIADVRLSRGQTTVTSQVTGFLSLQGTIVGPSGRLPSALATGIAADAKAQATRSFSS